MHELPGSSMLTQEVSPSAVVPKVWARPLGGGAVPLQAQEAVWMNEKKKNCYTKVHCKDGL